MPSAAGATQAEWSLLRNACSANSPAEKTDQLHRSLEHPLDWNNVLDLAEHHGVSSLLCHALTPITEKIPSQVIETLKQRYGENVRKCLLLARELIRILDSLNAQGIEAIAYKGLALSEVVYGDIALRQSGDIDLLIRPQDFLRAKSAVRDLGFTPHAVLTEPEEQAYLVSGYECAFDCPAGPNLLEMQWALLPRFYAADLDLNALFRRAVNVTVAGRSMKVLSPEDLMLALSLHAAKHVWARLIWLCDIARIMSMPALDWQQIRDQAERLGIRRILDATLLLTNELFRSPLPDSSRSSVDGVAKALAAEICKELVRGKSCDVESVAYFRRMMSLRERTRDRLRFLQRLALTPGPGEWKTVRLPAALFPLYRLVRLSRLVARFARA
jgi:hypothetical protein